MHIVRRLKLLVPGHEVVARQVRCRLGLLQGLRVRVHVDHGMRGIRERRLELPVVPHLASHGGQRVRLVVVGDENRVGHFLGDDLARVVLDGEYDPEGRAISIR